MSFTLLTRKFIDFGYHRNCPFNDYLPFSVCFSKCNKRENDGLELAFSSSLVTVSSCIQQRMEISFSVALLLCTGSYHLVGSWFTPKWQINGERSKILQEEDLWQLLWLILSPLPSSLWNSEGCTCRHFLDILLLHTFALAISQSCKLWKLLSWSSLLHEFCLYKHYFLNFSKYMCQEFVMWSQFGVSLIKQLGNVHC